MTLSYLLDIEIEERQLNPLLQTNSKLLYLDWHLSYNELSVKCLCSPHSVVL